MHTRFLHTSDWQIGMTRHFLDDDAQSRFSEARLDAIERMGQLATESHCDFMVVAGDVLDFNNPTPQTRGRLREALAAIRCPVFLLPGNHDYLTSNHPFNDGMGLPHVTFIATPGPHPVPGHPGVEIVGGPYTARKPSTDVLKDASTSLPPASGIRIGVAHGQFERRSNDDDVMILDLAAYEQAISDRVVDYIAMGDTHSLQAVGTTRRIWFSGAPEVTAFKDADSGGGESNSGLCLIVDIKTDDDDPAAAATVSVEEHRIGRWCFEKFAATLNEAADVDEFFARLDNYPRKSQTVIKYGLEGSLSPDEYRRLERGLAERRDTFAALDSWDKFPGCEFDPTHMDFSAADGFIRVAVQRLIEMRESPDPTQHRCADDALKLLFRLSEQGGVNA